MKSLLFSIILFSSLVGYSQDCLHQWADTTGGGFSEVSESVFENDSVTITYTVVGVFVEVTFVRENIVNDVYNQLINSDGTTLLSSDGNCSFKPIHVNDGYTNLFRTPLSAGQCYDLGVSYPATYKRVSDGLIFVTEGVRRWIKFVGITHGIPFEYESKQTEGGFVISTISYTIQ